MKLLQVGHSHTKTTPKYEVVVVLDVRDVDVREVLLVVMVVVSVLVVTVVLVVVPW